MKPSTQAQLPAGLLDDLARLAEQERRLRLPQLDADLPWRLGQALRDSAHARGLAVTIEIRLGGQLAFFHAMPGTAEVNADWARRKRNVSELMDLSSYHVGRQLLRDGSSLEAKLGVATRDYAAHGGAVPLRLNSGVRVGTVTVSGLPQREDHAMVVEQLAGLCGLDPATCQLPPVA